MVYKKLKSTEEWSVITYEAGIELEKQITYPVRLSAVHVRGGWSRLATNQESFRRLLKEGLTLSPVFEVIIKWDNPTPAA